MTPEKVRNCRAARPLAALNLAALLGIATAALTGCVQNNSGGPSGRAEDDPEVWTIRCAVLNGADRMQRSKFYADALKKVQSLKPNLVIAFNDEQESFVCYGRYRRTVDRSGNETFTPSQINDLKTIRDLSMEVQGRTYWPFRLATMDLLPGGPSPHPEWNLARADAVYSLQVAVFYNDENFHARKYAAEEYCRILRQDEKQEAFYHHGPVHSIVTIGRFPAAAIVDTKETDPLTGTPRFVNRIVDPNLLALQRKYPNNLQNGRIMYDLIRDPQTHEVKDRVAQPSFPVLTPVGERKQAERSSRERSRGR